MPPDPEHLRATLDALLRDLDLKAMRDRDPVGLVWRYDDPADQEAAALIAAALAYGQVKLLRAAITQALDTLDPHPAQALTTLCYTEHKFNLRDFNYRMTPGPDLASLLTAIGATLQRHGSLRALFDLGFHPDHPDMRPALTAFVHALRADAPTDTRGLRYLLPDPARAGACKRLNLFLRWMVRGPDDVDLGVWSHLPTHRLTMPLDTHIARIGVALGLTSRRTDDWQKAAEITAALRLLDPTDPLRYDFALCHVGINQQPLPRIA